MHRNLGRLQEVWVDPAIYYVTACTYRRRRVLATDGMAKAVVTALEDASGKVGWCVGRYVVMPDHVHFFCSPGPHSDSLSEFVGRWKSWAMQRAWRVGHTGRLWQRTFVDHLLRSEESYGQKWEYVVQNPVSAGLCETSEDWPYQGEMVGLGM